jgi:hypothetical protein
MTKKKKGEPLTIQCETSTVTRHYQHRWTKERGYEKRNMLTKTKRWRKA